MSTITKQIAAKEHLAPKLHGLFDTQHFLQDFKLIGGRAGHWERDGVHFTAQGAEALGARLARILRPLVQRRDAEALGRFQGTRG